MQSNNNSIMSQPPRFNEGDPTLLLSSMIPQLFPLMSPQRDSDRVFQNGNSRTTNSTDNSKMCGHRILNEREQMAANVLENMHQLSIHNSNPSNDVRSCYSLTNNDAIHRSNVGHCHKRNLTEMKDFGSTQVQFPGSTSFLVDAESHSAKRMRLDKQTNTQTALNANKEMKDNPTKMPSESVLTASNVGQNGVINSKPVDHSSPRTVTKEGCDENGNAVKSENSDKYCKENNETEDQHKKIQQFVERHLFLIPAPESLAGMTLAGSNLRNYGLNVISIDYDTNSPPHAQQVIEPGHKLIVFGNYDDAQKYLTNIGAKDNHPIIPNESTRLKQFSRELAAYYLDLVPPPPQLLGRTLLTTPQVAQSGLNVISCNLENLHPSQLAQHRFGTNDLLLCYFPKAFDKDQQLETLAHKLETATTTDNANNMLDINASSNKDEAKDKS
ncbi:hypothetical protein RFI_25626 [Reticulomyxa filosa]|uniref:RCK C-terminal domain-containing protein n=1 Tax=Reticulomyxa filosa TaxID=46433 RepID=X6MCK4_RETFI|nr:hypothetical protein RFI_25626 [Reticulomyxa filosa]|eukprot:ETO11748.1 hypothetical protein RFI_25626 [Reticulomyxa filosa]